MSACVYVCVCVVVFNQQMGEKRKSVSLQCSGQTGSPEPRLLVEKMVSIALRDQLIKSIIF